MTKISLEHSSISVIVQEFQSRLQCIFDLQQRVEEHEKGKNYICYANSLYQLMDQFDDNNLQPNFYEKK